jgi:5-methyltetrahydrofolate--homocysteine methyltransferase
VVHVKDASRSVGVVEKLSRKDQREPFDQENRALQQRERDAFARRRQRKLVSYADTSKRRFRIDWQATPPPAPAFRGSKVLLDFPLGEIVPYIDWSPFFMAWELSGKYPQILSDKTVGEQARKLFQDAEQLLHRIIGEKLLRANAVYGFFPANSDGDDLIVWTDESRSEERVRFHMLRQQWEREGQTSFRSLADYLAPRESGGRDYLGAFALTAGIGADELASKFLAEHDDYSDILAKALGDRLAEGFAELLHERARQDWGFGRNEKLSKQDLIDEKYQGIRPAAGYPSCPDHTEKATLWELLNVEEATGMRLTESFAMLPASSVSGLYFWHPQATYFAVDLITRDQVEAYAARKGVGRTEVERWLAGNLGYDVS